MPEIEINELFIIWFPRFYEFQISNFCDFLDKNRNNSDWFKPRDVLKPTGEQLENFGVFKVRKIERSLN